VVKPVYAGATTALTATVPANQVTSSSAVVYYAIAVSGAITPNVGVSLTNATQVFAAGNGSATVRLWYAVAPIHS